MKKILCLQLTYRILENLLVQLYLGNNVLIVSNAESYYGFIKYFHMVSLFLKCN